MNKFLNNLDPRVKNYLTILSSDFPEWLLDYIYTPEMQHLDGISISCGTNISKIYNDVLYYSVLTHSVAVALIIWNFTHDKTQTLSGLFHDISTPSFKHCIDFLNGDSEYQESTEEKTEYIIKNSKQIMNILKKDNIKLEDVCNYHIYPIADNNTPRLCADRLEYTLSGGLFQVPVFTIKSIEDYYNNITILKNEDNLDELAFSDIDICENFIHSLIALWPRWIEDIDRLQMQFIADIIKSMNVKGFITVNDLYNLSDNEVINLIQNCKDDYIKNAFSQFVNSTRNSVYLSDVPNNKIYCTSVKGKFRYIDPLVNFNNKICRISSISEKANNDINNFLNMKTHRYIGFNFDFKPYF